MVEFGENEHGWIPVPGSSHRIRLEARIHPSEEWVCVVAFEWWAPPSADLMKRYIAHRNEPAADSETVASPSGTVSPRP